jgi:hypothetical protein
LAWHAKQLSRLLIALASAFVSQTDGDIDSNHIRHWFLEEKFFGAGKYRRGYRSSGILIHPDADPAPSATIHTGNDGHLSLPSAQEGFPAFCLSPTPLDLCKHSIDKLRMDCEGVQFVPWKAIYQLERVGKRGHKRRPTMEILRRKTGAILI